MKQTNWDKRSSESNFNFNWNEVESPGYDITWCGRFEGDWNKELQEVIEKTEPRTWRNRGKRQSDEDYLMEEEDLIRAGMNKDSVILRKYFEVEGPFKAMCDIIGLKDYKAVFHIQHPGELLSLHIDKQYEYNEDPNDTARFLVFLDDWKPGQFAQWGRTSITWKKGDIYWFDWQNIPHATANAGFDKRPLLVITGTITDKTRRLILTNHKTLKV